MDILERAFILVQEELGQDIFNDSARLRLSLQLRQMEGGDRHYIASTTALECQERNKQILHALSTGATPSQVAERFGLSRQHVYRILSLRKIA